MNIPPVTNLRAYATPVLKAWQAELEQRQTVGKPGRPNPLLARIIVELSRRPKANPHA
jgi:hypothetical protein